MTNVLFKQGTQASLDTIRFNKTAIDGSFYLTNDTHRLYIGRPDGDAVPVNEGVNTVATLDDLPQITAANAPSYVGQFYYVSGSNILCVYSASTQGGAVKGGWVQINPNTDTHLSDLKINITVENGVATVSTSITEADSANNGSADTTTRNFKVQGAGGITIGATEVSDGNNDVLTITGDQYAIAAGTANSVTNEVPIELSSDGGHDSSVTLKGGENVTLSKTNDGAIKIDATDTQIASATGANETSGFSVTVTDSAGNSEKATINPQIVVGGTQATQQTISFQNGTATLPVYTASELDAKLAGLDAMTYKGTVGTRSIATAVAANGAKIGDTYLLDDDIAAIVTSTGNKPGTKGDMIIARGTEGADGNITAATLVWDIIPSGNDNYTDTNYIGKPTTGTGASGDGNYADKHYEGFKLQDTIENESAGEVDFYAGDNINITGTAFTKGQDIIGNKILISHADVANSGGSAAPATKIISSGSDTDFTQAPGTTFSVTAVTEVTRDGKGHVIGVKTKDLVLKDTQATIDKNDYQAATATASGITTATVTNTIHSVDEDGDQVSNISGTFGLASSSLSLSVTNTGTGNDPKSTVVTADIVWGTF